MPKFTSGDVVMLRSGGPKMTVDTLATEGMNVKCGWFHDGAYIWDNFNINAIKHVVTIGD